jgi:hypothetical protein
LGASKTDCKDEVVISRTVKNQSITWSYLHGEGGNYV